MRHHYISASPTDSSHWGTAANTECGVVLLQISGAEGEQCRLALTAPDALRFSHALHDVAVAPSGIQLPPVREDVTEGIASPGGGTGPRAWWSLQRDNAGSVIMHFHNTQGDAGEIRLTPGQAGDFASSAETDARVLQPVTQESDADSARIAGMLSAYSVLQPQAPVTPLYGDMD